MKQNCLRDHLVEAAADVAREPYPCTFVMRLTERDWAIGTVPALWLRRALAGESVETPFDWWDDSDRAVALRIGSELVHDAITCHEDGFRTFADLWNRVAIVGAIVTLETHRELIPRLLTPSMT